MKKLYFSILVLFLSCNLFPQQWQWQNSKPVGVALYDVVGLSSTRVLAFGMAGTEIISTDAGETWKINSNLSNINNIWGSYFLDANTGFIAGAGGLLMKTSDGGSTWAAKVSGTTNILYDIEFLDANNGIACGASGTVIRTTDGGDTWTSSTATSSSTNYKISIVSSSIVYIGTSNSAARLIKSTDFGATFTNATPALITSGSVYGMYILDANNYWVASSVGIIATTDGGTSWSNQQAQTNTMYDVKFINSTNGYAVDGNGIVWTTTNAGTNWTSTQLSTTKSLRAISSNSGNLFLVGDCGNIYKSIDNGVSWSAKYTTATQEQIRKIIFKDDLNGWAGDAAGVLLQTIDGGQNWTTLNNLGHQIYSIAMPTSTTWYIGCDGNNYYKTTDGGTTFIPITHPLTGETFWMTGFADSLNGYAGGSSGKIIKTTDGGNSWTDISTAAGFGTSTIYEIAVSSKDTFYIAGLSAKLKKSTDGGTSFTAMVPGIAGSFFTVKFRDSNFGFVGGQSLAVSMTTDAGATWTPITLPSGLTSNSSIWGFGFKDPYVWLSTVNGEVVYSSNNGVDWTIAAKPTSSSLFCFAVSNNNMWLCGAQGNILKGHADASPLPVELTSFTSNIQGLNIVLNWSTSTEVNSNRFEIQRISLNFNESNWVTISSVSAAGNSYSTKHYSFTDSKLQTGKYNYRLKLIDNDGTFKYSNIITANLALPTKFAISQNYPNPFNPTTKVDYQIPVDSKILIEVFNIAGQRVAQIVNQEQSAGYYTLDFGNSVKLSSGVYIYRMIAIDKATGNNFSSIKKMIMLK